MPVTLSKHRLLLLALASASLVACGDDDSALPPEQDSSISDTEDASALGEDAFTEPDVSPTYACGNGYIDLNEACDDGAENSDESPNACRSDCTMPVCGDAVVDHTEDCDDGANLGGDGCSALCQDEEGTQESEPNDSPLNANMLPAGETLFFGEISDGDVDCVTYFAPTSSNIRVELIGKQDVTECQSVSTSDDEGNETTEEVCDTIARAPSCEGNPVLVTYDPLDDVIASNSVSSGGACPAHNNITNDELQNVHEGLYTTCISGFGAAPVRGWQLKVEVESACINGELYGIFDMDEDGWIPTCDDDDDGDGKLDDEDPCPLNPDQGLTQTIPLTKGNNFAYAVAFDTDVGGYEADCVISDDETSGFDPASISAGVGQVDGTTGFLGLALRTDSAGTLNLEELLPYSESGSRYVVYYLESDVESAASLRFSSDQNHQVWFNGELVADEEDCGGVPRNWNQDARADVTLQRGLNRVVARVTQTSTRRTGALRMWIDENDESTWQRSDLRLLLSADGSTPESTIRGLEGFSCNWDRSLLL